MHPDNSPSSCESTSYHPSALGSRASQVLLNLKQKSNNELSPNEEVRNFPEARQRTLAIPRGHLLTHQKRSAVGRSLQILAPLRSGMTKFSPAPAPELCRHKSLTQQHQQQPVQGDRGFLVELSMLISPRPRGCGREGKGRKTPPARCP